MPPIPTSTSLDGFQCASGEEQRKACTGEPAFADCEGKSYCVLHYPAKNKVLEFKEAIHRKINTEEFNFRGVWFPEKISFTQPFTKDVNFAGAVFSDDADFSSLDFRNKADFSKTTFQGTATFNDATFCDLASFVGAKFLKNADFINATFEKKAEFGYSEFCLEANFDTYFDSEADFIYVFFEERHISGMRFSTDSLIFDRRLSKIISASAESRFLKKRSSISNTLESRNLNESLFIVLNFDRTGL
jgi:uncharacterized protein YjbI with pentapeptide repeats